MNRINNLTAFIYQTKSIAFTIFSYLIFALSQLSRKFSLLFGQKTTKELCHENNVVENVFITFGKRINSRESKTFIFYARLFCIFIAFLSFFLRHILSSIFSSDRFITYGKHDVMKFIK
jgi:hypothetical protein